MSYVEEVGVLSALVSAAAAVASVAIAVVGHRFQRQSMQAARRSEDAVAVLKRPVLEIEVDPVGSGDEGNGAGIRYQVFVMNAGPWAAIDLRIELQLASGPLHQFAIPRLEAQPPATRLAVPPPTGQADPRFYYADSNRSWEGYDRLTVTFSDEDNLATWTQGYRAFRRWDPAKNLLETTEADEQQPARLLRRNY